MKNDSSKYLNVGGLLLLLFLFIGACESADGQIRKQETAAKSATSVTLAPDGMAVFRQRCVTCHGADGNLGLNGAKQLSESVLPLEERINIISHGKKLMPPYGSLLSTEEIKAVAEYTLTLKK